MQAGGAVAELDLGSREVWLIGYGPDTGPRRTTNTLNRLRLRAVVLDGGPGARVVLLSGDFWAASTAVQLRVEELLRARPRLGLGGATVFFSGTHTHSSPGGLYESPYYRQFAGAWPFDQGFDPSLVEVVAAQLVQLVETACARREDATLSWGEATFSGQSINRSYAAYARNFGGSAPAPEAQQRLAIDPALRMLFVRPVADGARLLGAWGAVNCHGTVFSKALAVCSPDLLGRASRELEGWQANTATPWVLCAGAIGDVDPQPSGMSRDAFIAERARGLQPSNQLAATLAAALRGAVQQAVAHEGVRVDQVSPRGVRHEVRVARATLADGRRMPDYPQVGEPVLAGSELGRGPLSQEGVRRSEPDDGSPHWPKLSSHVFVQHINGELARHSPFLSLSLVKLGPVGWLVGLPGEPTTMLAQNLRAALAPFSGGLPVMVCGVTGGYNGYFVTAPEYEGQHYEGASCIWGRHTEAFLREHLVLLAAAPTAAPPGPTPPPSVGAAVARAEAEALVRAQARARPFETDDAQARLARAGVALVSVDSPDPHARLVVDGRELLPVAAKALPKRKGKQGARHRLTFLVDRAALGRPAELREARARPVGERFVL